MNKMPQVRRDAVGRPLRRTLWRQPTRSSHVPRGPLKQTISLRGRSFGDCDILAFPFVSANLHSECMLPLKMNVCSKAYPSSWPPLIALDYTLPLRSAQIIVGIGQLLTIKIINLLTINKYTSVGGIPRKCSAAAGNTPYAINISVRAGNSPA